MSQADYRQGSLQISQINSAAASQNLTLVAPGAGRACRILWIACFSDTATKADIKVTQSDGSTIMCHYGGSGIQALGLTSFVPLYGNPNGSALVGKVNDTPIVFFTTTGGTNTDLSVGYDFVQA